MNGRTLLLGHRGHRCALWCDAENSLAAFDRALAWGCDGVELDLRLSADERVVIHHDEELHFEGESLSIAQTSLRSLRRLHPSLATLDQVLHRYGRRAWMDLEIKSLDAVAPAVALLQRHPPQRGFVLSCFDETALHEAAALAPLFPRCLNLKRPCSLRRLREAKVAWVAPHQASCTRWYVHWLHQHGWRVLVWTVNHPRKMQMLIRAGAEAICSDMPQRLVAQSQRDSRATAAGALASFPRDEHGSGGYSAAGRTAG